MHGFLHVGSSFFVGVLCYQLKLLLPENIKLASLFYVLLFVMVGIFVAPYELDSDQRMLWKLLLAPMLVISGSYVRLTNEQVRVCTVVGDLSYPIYALHYPIFTWVNGMYQKLNGDKSAAIEVAIFIPLVLSVSYLALRFYDKPMRTNLTRLIKAARKPSVSAVPL